MKRKQVYYNQDTDKLEERKAYSKFQEISSSENNNVIIRSVTVTLTDDEIKALPTTGITLVAAPGANKVLCPIACFGVLDNSAGGYADIAGASWQLFLGNNSGVALPLENNLGNTSSFSFMLVFPYTGVGMDDFDGDVVSAPMFGVANQPLKIKDDYNGISDYTSGDPANTLKVTTLYTVIDL